MLKKYYLSSPLFTVQVNVKDGFIVWGAPVITRFLGQPLGNLTRWSKADVVKEINAASPDPDTSPATSGRV